MLTIAQFATRYFYTWAAFWFPGAKPLWMNQGHTHKQRPSLPSILVFTLRFVWTSSDFNPAVPKHLHLWQHLSLFSVIICLLSLSLRPGHYLWGLIGAVQRCSCSSFTLWLIRMDILPKSLGFKMKAHCKPWGKLLYFNYRLKFVVIYSHKGLTGLWTLFCADESLMNR